MQKKVRRKIMKSADVIAWLKSDLSDGEKMRQWRHAHDLTQRQVLSLLDYDYDKYRHNYSAIENGRKPAPKHLIQHIALIEILGVKKMLD